MGQVFGNTPTNKAERQVVRKLQEFSPPDWLIFPNRHYTYKEGSRIYEKEVDAIVLVPGKGMVVLEVKGTERVEVDDRGIWWRSYENKRERIEGDLPHEQACKNMHNMQKLLARELGVDLFPGCFAWLVVYPRGEITGRLDLFESHLLVDSKSMQRIVNRCRQVLEERGTDAQGVLFSANVVDKLRTLLSYERFKLKPVDTEVDVEEDLCRIDELTVQQFAVLRGLLDWPSLAIVGPAGSGKTVIAIWHLQDAIATGKRALYVCFNKRLAEFLGRMQPDLAKYITSVDRFFLDFAGVSVPTGLDQAGITKFFREDLPGFALDKIADEEAGEPLDLLVIDEGQDFSATQRGVLQELRAESGQLVVFADKRQDLFRAATDSEYATDAYFTLSYNCRNTISINDAANGLSQAEPIIKSMPGIPDGVAPTVLVANNGPLMAQRAWKLASNWTTEGGVTILSPYKLENSCMANAPRGHGLVLSTELEALDSGGDVYFSTVRGFKGLESSAVILIHALIPSEAESSVFRVEDLYVACTRARARLAIICPDQVAGDWYEKMIRSAPRI